MGKIIKINHVCDILIKDTDGNFRKVFKIEGDKISDPSIYIHLPNVDNPSKRLHYSYHVKEKNGLVIVHLKHDCTQKLNPTEKQQKPLAQRKRPFFSCWPQKIERYPIKKEPKKEDIVIPIKSIYLQKVYFIFYPDKNTLTKEIHNKNQMCVFSQKIPFVNSADVYLGVVINKTDLIEIQKTA
ncbi:MAG: hypothetical protein K9M36_01440 [Candidatus Pacebacteria bacterium]|nr:hypothetical protein [Candidatus Paceibacterota bacterium]